MNLHRAVAHSGPVSRLRGFFALRMGLCSLGFQRHMGDLVSPQSPGLCPQGQWQFLCL